MPVIALGVRSLDEESGKDSAGDQVRIVKAAALEQPGRFIFSEHTDHGSGFHGNRGQQTQAALDNARKAAEEYGRAELWVFKSERLGRGSGRRDEARSVLEVFVEMRRAGVDLRSVEDDVYFTNPMLVGVADEMAHKYSKDLSAHVKRGMRQNRTEKGLPVGAVPHGYHAVPIMVDGQPLMVKDKVVRERVIDRPGSADVYDEMCEMTEQGLTPVKIAQALNDRGLRTRRGKPWTSGNVRRVLRNDVYLGQKMYPQLITPERWNRIQELLDDSTPASVQLRKGGRPIKREGTFLLNGVLFCAACNAPMRCRTDGMRYVCSSRRKRTGLCDAPSIPASVAHEQVLQHLHRFIDRAADWIAEQVQAQESERQARQKALRRKVVDVGQLNRQRDKHLAQYRKLVDEGSSVAHLALEEVARMDQQLEAQRQAVEDEQAMLSEWTGPPDVDEALDYYNQIVDVVGGKLDSAQGMTDLNAVLSQTVAGIWMKIEGGRLKAEFALKDLPADRFPLPHATDAYMVAMTRVSLFKPEKSP
jgi:site-specific DNA recombinase